MVTAVVGFSALLMFRTPENFYVILQVLFQGLKATVAQIITIVMAFLVICCGITILQLSKVDPTELKTLDRRSTLLLEAAKKETEKMEEKDLTGVEEPGMDSVRGSFGPLGSMIRARTLSRMSQSSRSAGSVRSRIVPSTPRNNSSAYDGLRRHQLYDAPVPSFGFSVDAASDIGSSIIGSPSVSSPAAPPRTPTIKFRSEDLVHKYQPASSGADASAIHERREASHMSVSPSLQPIDKNTAGGFPNSQSGSQIALLPPLTDESEIGGIRTAPSSSFATTLTHVDPFDGAPATADPTGFSSSKASDSNSDSDSPSRLRSHFSAYDDEENQSAWRSSSRSPTRLRIQGRGRLPSERGYPRTGGDDDKEESISLVATAGSREDIDESGDDGEVQIPSGGIRLVGQTGGKF